VTSTYTYSVILEPAEEGGFVVHVPALPEICTEGDTEDEALAMAKDAIELVIESRIERGEPIPSEFQKPLVRQVTVSREHERAFTANLRARCGARPAESRLYNGACFRQSSPSGSSRRPIAYGHCSSAWIESAEARHLAIHAAPNWYRARGAA